MLEVTKKKSMEISRKNEKLQKPRGKVKKKFILFIYVCFKNSPMESEVLSMGLFLPVLLLTFKNEFTLLFFY